MNPVRLPIVSAFILMLLTVRTSAQAQNDAAAMSSVRDTVSNLSETNLKATPNTSVQLDEVIVTGTNDAVQRRLLPYTVSVVGPRQLESAGQTQVLSAISGMVPSLFVTQRSIFGFGVSNGGSGGIKLRGVGGGNGSILMMVDGQPQFAGIYSHHIADLYSKEYVDRVEVLRGPGSVLYGSNAMGGAINVITKNSHQKSVRTTIESQYGSYNTWLSSLTNTTRFGRFSSLLSLSYSRTDGNIKGMDFSQAILTVFGGMTSHAAVVARGMGKCCVSGCGDIKMDEENKKFELSGKTYREGDWISLNGSTGNIYDGAVPTTDAVIGGEFGRVMGWADQFRRLKVRTNADTPHDAAQARKFGAQGIGLCRTEHMFFNEDRIPAIRRMICSDTVEEREAALAVLEPMQQSDFEGIYEAMEGCPVTIRFLDPPLHEFVPTEEADIEKLASDMGKTVAEIKNIIAGLHEFNPMMGHRGCRLAVTYPEIAAMQTRAVIKAALAVQAHHPEWTMVPEIMIPLVGEAKELKYVKDIVVKTADELIKAAGSDMKYLVGTMIEIPRAALTADEIAKEAAFFSFGTNDLTQMTFGFSRDDAGKFLGAYYDKKIYENDPFAKLDQKGVGKLVDMACKLGRSVNPDLHLGICGEHGGDPSSVEFCHRTGLDYVSCSPFRVPIARLAAAQAAIKNPRK